MGTNNSTISKRAKKEKGITTNRKKGDRFVDKIALFESYILAGKSQQYAMDKIGMSYTTLENHLNKNPEYKLRLKELRQEAKENIGEKAKAIMYNMIMTGETPVGELSARDYRQALEYFTSHFTTTKGDFTKTEHKITETIKEVPRETKEKVAEVWDIEGAVEVEQVPDNTDTPQIEQGEESE